MKTDLSFESHRKAIAAWRRGSSRPRSRCQPGKERPTTVSADESTRRKPLQKPSPANPPPKDGGTVTAGNAPGLNDGASALVVTSLAFAKAHGLKPLARVTAYATGGGEPREIFFAPVLAVRTLMEKAGTKIGDYDLIEANEAFAVQALADGRELGWDWNRVNVHGGAVALGHPIGASGARVLTTLLYALRDRGGSTVSPLSVWAVAWVALSVERCDKSRYRVVGRTAHILESFAARLPLPGAVVVALAAQVVVPVPFSPVPMTLQPLACLPWADFWERPADSVH